MQLLVSEIIAGLLAVAFYQFYDRNPVVNIFLKSLLFCMYKFRLHVCTCLVPT